MGLQIEKNKEELLREIADRERRKLSAVVFNVPESRSDDVDNRNQHDREAVTISM